MPTEVIMPKLGMGMEQGTVVAWQKRVGDPVRKGECVVEIRSEKIEFEVESPVDGVLLDILVPDDGVVPCGTVIGYVGEPQEARPVATGDTEVPSASSPGSGLAPTRSEGVPKISPAARKLARELGVDVRSVTGTGPGGRITKEDVERAAEVLRQAGGDITRAAPSAPAVSAAPGGAGTSSAAPRTAVEPAAASPVASNLIPDKGAREVVPLTPMRQAIAARMMQSLHQSAQLTITMRADVTAAVQLLHSHADWLKQRYGVKFTLTDCVARATALALQDHPEVNGWMMEDGIQLAPAVHLGIAVALDNGLVVPVVRDADRLSFGELGQAIKSVSQRARAGKLEPGETGGSTFTVTNLGGYGIEFFTPILNPPEIGILGVGAAQETAAFIAGEWQACTQLPLSLTFDHRALDGAPAAAFLSSVKRYLEEPVRMVL
ncbi:MAG: 2-oxo acid dehydrogenase subunit E2 [Alicyclobacillus herbarius]|uniref:dihydrolipoamide acetyltransferase family protein n=1 Tax=Alicyclobacillus herbarius TaxID=122960 RepID=UPI002355D909|nr:dihydrolipoamide acetyltransferase family protein [Alicyclobacillus herbarius]MCL6633230.1 2-oxo acid dehydrogenase subunit E2 [Alicyclobacillus herbarius]